MASRLIVACSALLAPLAAASPAAANTQPTTEAAAPPSPLGLAPTVGTAAPAPAALPDPLTIVVSLPDQRATVFRGLDVIDGGRVSTGRRGHRTPAGIYSILEKRKRHFSNLYDSAPMPYMQRLTWSGIALHEGNVRRGFASHGCVRLPRRLAKSLFRETDRGVRVVVADGMVAPQPFAHPALPQPGRPSALTGGDAAIGPVFSSVDLLHAAAFDVETDADRAAVFTRAAASTAERSPVRVLISRRTGRERLKDVQDMLNRLGYDAGEPDGFMGPQTARAIKAFQDDRGDPKTGMVDDALIETLHRYTGKPHYEGHLYVRRDFKEVFDAPVKLSDPETPLGAHLFTALGYRPGETTTAWSSLTLDGGDPAAALNRIEIPHAIHVKLASMLTPGSSIALSDEGLGRETGRGTGFIVQP